MIRMNPKFKSKIKTEIEELVEELPIFGKYNSENQSMTLVNDKSVFDLIIYIIVHNKGKIRLTEDIYMIDDTMYYLPKEGSAYTIPKVNWEPILRDFSSYVGIKNILELSATHVTNDYIELLIEKYIDESKVIDMRLFKTDLLHLLRTSSGLIYYSTLRYPNSNGNLYNILIYIRSEFNRLLENIIDCEVALNRLDEKDIRFITNRGFYFFAVSILLVQTQFYLKLISMDKTTGADLLNLASELYIFTKRPDVDILRHFMININKDTPADSDLLFPFDVLDEEYNDPTLPPKCKIIYERTQNLLLSKVDIYEMFSTLFAQGNSVLNINNFSGLNVKHNDVEPLSDELGFCKKYGAGETIRYIKSQNDIEIENYFNRFIAQSKSDIICAFRSDIWRESLDRLILSYSSNNFTKKANSSILTSSFKNISMFIPVYLSASISVGIEMYYGINVELLNPKDETDEEKFNSFMEKLEFDFLDTDNYNLIYSELYDSFYSREHQFALVTSTESFETALICLDDYNKSYVIGIRGGCADEAHIRFKEIGSGNLNNFISTKLLDNEFKKYLTYDITIFKGVGAYAVDNKLCKSKFHESYRYDFIKFTYWYYLNALCEYLNSKQDDSIELHLVEVEETKNKKRNSSSFTVHERKSSWVRAHYRHYKSGVVTLVTAHARKGCNSVNNKLILNL